MNRYAILVLGLLAGPSNAADTQPAPAPEVTGGETRSPSIRTVPLARTFRFQPATDVTADELARLEPYLRGKPLYDEDWEALGTATRHLRESR